MRIFVDTDCGVDDALALALLVQHPDVEVAGVTSTSGNTDAAQAARNAQFVLRLMGDHTTVTAGPNPPQGFIGRTVHGRDGLGGQGPAGAPGPGDPEAASREIRTFCENVEPESVLLCLGPLTNLAAAAPRRWPRIVAVGGAGILGEQGSGRDPNSAADRAATQWVIDNLQVDWVTMNSCAEVWLAADDFRTPPVAGGFMRRIHEAYGWHCAERSNRRQWSPSAYDALAALAAMGGGVEGWTSVSPLLRGAAVWGAHGGAHRMLCCSSGRVNARVVSSAVRRARLP